MSREYVIECIENASHVVTLAVGGRVVAHAEATRNALAPHRATVSAAVEPDHWGSGTGSRVLSMALAWCDDPGNGIDWVDGWAWADNERALRMDAKLGFEVVGRLQDVWRDGNRSRDQVMLVRKRRL